MHSLTNLLPKTAILDADGWHGSTQLAGVVVGVFGGAGGEAAALQLPFQRVCFFEFPDSPFN
jgi:hypothetical protein